ncbi:hypothetical protein [Muricoccus radiodurans]|uniref:hypothetical protein n=1 Tax=Muricoccus radiodurans TaxID=2231721 RepID=UPI003CF1914F
MKIRHVVFALAFTILTGFQALNATGSVFAITSGVLSGGGVVLLVMALLGRVEDGDA